jgi:dienelactone hydrolase
MKAIVFSIFLLWFNAALSQKKPLAYTDLGSWPEIIGEKISNDGKFVVYGINKKGAATDWYVKASDNSWQRKLGNVLQPSVTSDSRYIVYLKGADSIIIYDPVTDITEMVLPGNSYRLSTDEKNLHLACMQRSGKMLRLYNLKQKNIQLFPTVENVELAADGKILVLVTDSSNRKFVQWIDLVNNTAWVIATGPGRFSNFIFDASLSQLAFTEEINSGTETATSLRYFRAGMDTALIKVSPAAKGLDSGYLLQAVRPRFNNNGTKLFFTVAKKKNQPEKDNTKADVTVWHYNDVYLPAEQAQQLTSFINCAAVVQTGNNNIIQLTRQGNNPLILSEGKADFVIVQDRSNFFSMDTSAANIPSYYLVNATTGGRTLLVARRDITISLSPAERFVVWYDPVKDGYFSYEIQTAQVRNITQSLKGLLKPSASNARLTATIPFGIAAWLPGDSSLFLYDQYDTWKIDPRGTVAPVNITHHYGRLHQIILRIWNENSSDYDAPVIDNPTILLCAFEIKTNRNGFFKTSLQQTQDPVPLTMDDCLYYAHARFNFAFLRSASLYKAKNAERWLVRRMRADQYPELFATVDFKKFTQLTTVQPEAAYNWMKAELIHYTLPNGKQAAAVLYKPTDFDAARKYPVTFYFYEKLSHRLHQYIPPTPSDGSLNIPFLVSNGYLICTPDIEYTKGKPGESALRYVTAAANYIAQLPYADAKKMGIQGHSFGGYQVNYIVSRTNRFAAAQSSAGAADFISYYNGNYRESSAQFYFEKGQGRIGNTLWKKPELFQQNSPVFNADKVTTPVLIMHNKEDGEVPFQQGLEWFTALKRSGKKVWLLQYDKEYHGIVQYKNQLDLTIRMKQFFDHYLKDTPQPVWMRQGVPASAKNTEDGLEY